MGLIPSSQTLICTISAAPTSATDGVVLTIVLVRFGARVTRPAYRRSPLAVAGTPDILMVSALTRFSHDVSNSAKGGAKMQDDWKGQDNNESKYGQFGGQSWNDCVVYYNGNGNNETDNNNNNLLPTFTVLPGISVRPESL